MEVAFEKMKDLQFLKESYVIKLDDVNYIINIGSLEGALVIKVNSNEIQDVYQSLFTIEELKSIAKSIEGDDLCKEKIKRWRYKNSCRYCGEKLSKAKAVIKFFDNINDIIYYFFYCK